MLNVLSTNSSVNYKLHTFYLTQTRVDMLAGDYDLLLDCTDHPSSRYMISDLAVAVNLPLISASALKTEGQLLVLNYPPCRFKRSNLTNLDSGFCYRCIFPHPPPPESVSSCGESGILGPVVGIMGILMATEAIKIITADWPRKLEDSAKNMLLYSAYDETPFRRIRLRGKRTDCEGCVVPLRDFQARKEELRNNCIDYGALCGTRTSGNVSTERFRSCRRISPSDFRELRINTTTQGYLLIDVRDETEFGICHLPEANNFPLSQIQQDSSIVLAWLKACSRLKNPLLFICRYGNDSREAVLISESYLERDHQLKHSASVMDIEGGLKGWKDKADPNFPEY